MIRLIFFLGLMLTVATSSAQISEGQDTDTAQMIGLDYSMSDYNIKKIDEDIIGKRLAQILSYLEANYHQ